MCALFRSVLSIAGYDPSAGAGVLADIKTVEQIGVYGCAVNTAITYQNDIDFKGIDWLTINQIRKQFDVLAERFRFEYVKVGLVQSFEVLQQIVLFLTKYDAGIKIIWDPILKASAGFRFHELDEIVDFTKLLEHIYLVTPNHDEIKELTGLKDAEAAAKYLSQYTNVLLKGGHSTEHANDLLYIGNGTVIMESERLPEQYSKHGSGCVLSAAITAYLQTGLTLENACLKAKEYTAAFLKSNEGLTGFHHTFPALEDAAL
jgi:hydroxymethylpyrimidine/phosphomethylpyrimidine kinase